MPRRCVLCGPLGYAPKKPKRHCPRAYITHQPGVQFVNRGILSNFDDCPLKFEDVDFRSSEQAYQWSACVEALREDLAEEAIQAAPNDTAYKRWCYHSGLKLLCKLCRTSPPPAMGARFTVFWACRPCGPAGWLALLLTKAGDVETNPGPTTQNKKVWICDICINKYISESRYP